MNLAFRRIVARALLNKIASYNSSNKTSNLSVGTIFYWAASSREPAGKSNRRDESKTSQADPESSTDISILRENGMQALREAKNNENYWGGTRSRCISHSRRHCSLLCSCARTIRRDIERLRKQGIDTFLQEVRKWISVKGYLIKPLSLNCTLKNYQYTDIQRQNKTFNRSIEPLHTRISPG